MMSKTANLAEQNDEQETRKFARAQGQRPHSFRAQFATQIVQTEISASDLSQILVSSDRAGGGIPHPAQTDIRATRIVQTIHPTT